MSVAVAYTSREREKIEVFKFSLPVTIMVPALALVWQAFVPTKIHFLQEIDVPLLVTIFFAVARRSPVSGLLTGAIIGMMQDTLGHHPIGLFGIAKTVVGYAASSIGVKIDVENPGSRLLLTTAFYLLHQGVYFVIARGLVREALTWRWGHTALLALANAVFAVVLFAILDRLRQRG
jgi:rod shape-determining protein MreD